MPKFLFKPTDPNGFLKFIVFKNHLGKKPHLHIKGANLLKTRFLFGKNNLGFVGYFRFFGYLATYLTL